MSNHDDDPSKVYIACGYTDAANALKPAPVPFQVVMLKIGLGAFQLINQELALKAMETHPEDSEEGIAARARFVNLHTFEAIEWMMQNAVEPNVEAEKPRLVTMFIRNGVMNGAYLNARSDNWPLVEDLNHVLKEQNPVPCFLILPQMKKPTLVH